MFDAEVLIVGGGTAGLVAALNLAPFRRVVLVERRPEVKPRIGESLVPAARRLLVDMGLLEGFRAGGHEPWYGRRSVWGRDGVEEVDFLSDPDGHGWHLDRAGFEQWLREVARLRGTQLLLPASVEGFRHDGRRWQIRLTAPMGSAELAADLVIDAGGRSAPIASRLGGRSTSDDRLVCAWVQGADRCGGGRGMTYVEATAGGWWYTAPLPAQRRILAFHTDADLLPDDLGRDGRALVAHAGSAASLASLLTETGFTPESMGKVVAAHGTALQSAACGKKRWMAAGDAAISFDPLASRGLFNAMFTGLAAAEAAHRVLCGDSRAMPEYARMIDRIKLAYHRQLRSAYASERRWSDVPFWKRRGG